MKRDDNAQIHILEMLTLFWLFFMSAAFLISVHVPDSPTMSLDAELEFAGKDAINHGLGLSSEEGVYDSRLAELLAANDRDGACELIQNSFASGVEGNCWLARDSGTSQPQGEVATPNGEVVVTHSLVSVDDNLWTISLDLWVRGGGD
ncbi:MAG: hypothetical protein QGI21_04390 [Candidatus Poseidoniaceae archaeon]|nr:hypothetical protein [Candidatus Poseidoniaceae archaeon]